MRIGFLWESLKERDYFKDQDLVGGIIKMDLREIEWGVMDWIHLAEDREQWRALVNIRVP
jgi:hypothetical protein